MDFTSIRQLFYIIILAMLFSGCAKTTYEKGDIKVRAFLSDKNRCAYVFLSEKYSFVFEEKKTVDNINEMFRIHGELKNIEIHASTIFMGDSSRSLLSGISKQDKERTKQRITFYVHPSRTDINKLKKYGFKKSTLKRRKGYYEKPFFLYGRFTLTDEGLMSKYQKSFLKRPLKFRFFNRNNSTMTYDASKTSKTIKKLGVAPIAIPAVIAGWGAIGVVGATATVIKGF